MLTRTVIRSIAERKRRSRFFPQRSGPSVGNYLVRSSLYARVIVANFPSLSQINPC